MGDKGEKEEEGKWRRAGTFLLETGLPVVGVISYQAFAVHICNPCLITRFLTPQTAQQVISCLNINTAIGSAVYLYHRPHLQILPAVQRVLFSAFASTAFNFGSFFACLMLRNLFPEDWKKAGLALVTSTSLLLIGRAYARHVDSLVLSREPT